MEKEPLVLADWCNDHGLYELAKAFAEINLPLGENYFVQTVTHYYVGRLTAYTSRFLLLENCSWVPDTGRLHNAISQGIEKQKQSEVEPIGTHYVALGAVVGVTPYKHELPTKQK